MQQGNPRTPPPAPHKPKRPTEHAPLNVGTPKKAKPLFSPSTPAVPTPDSSSQPTHQTALQNALKVTKQADRTIVIGDDTKRDQIKQPVPPTAKAHTYRGLTQHLLALLRYTRERGSFKLAQLKGLTQTLSGFLNLLSSEQIKPEKISKIKKITLLLNNFIETNLSLDISEDEFKKNAETFYVNLRFEKNQAVFLTQLLLHLNAPAENYDDSLQSHMNRATQDIAHLHALILLLKKTSADFQQILVELLQERVKYLNIKLQILNAYFLPLKKAAENHDKNYTALERELSQEEATVKKLLALKKTQRIREHTLTSAQENIISIQKELDAVSNKINHIHALQNSFAQCLTLSSTNENTHQRITDALKVNTGKLNAAVNTLLNNGDEILTPDEMQPSPHTPKYVSPAARVAPTPNTETKLFIQSLQEFVETFQVTLQEKENTYVEQEIPTFAEAFPELRQQKAALENYARKLGEDSAEYMLLQQQIVLITQHMASGIALLQQNHRIMANLAEQEKEPSPFRIHSLLRREPQTSPQSSTPPRKIKPVDMEFVSRFSPPQLTAQKALSFDESSSFKVVPVNFASNIFPTQDGAEITFPHTQVLPGTQILSDEPAAPAENAAQRFADIIRGMLEKQLPHKSSKKNYRVHEVLGDGECGLTAFGITREDAYALLCNNLQRAKPFLVLAVEEALLTLPFQAYLEEIQIDMNDEDQIIRAYIDFDVKDRQIDHGWSHPGVLQALAEIQGIGLRIWRLDERHNLIPHRTAEYDYAEHIPAGATQITDLLFINGNHFNRIEFEPEVPQANHSPLQFFAAREPSQKRARVFYLSADEAINQFTEISTHLKDGLRKLYRIFTTEQRLDLESIHQLFDGTITSIEKLIEQVNDLEANAAFNAYIEQISLLKEEAKAFSPKEYLEKAYTTFVGPLEEKQDNRKSASPPRL